MASGPLAFLGQDYQSPLRRSVLDDVTGNPVITSAPTGEVRQRASLLPLGVTDSGSYTLAVPQGVFDAIDYARAPQRAYSGELQVWDPATGHTSDAAREAATGLAGLAMTGSTPFSAPAGALRSFGGRNAATADLSALSRAEQMAGLGGTRQAIWDRTGWFQGPDQKWRFEIPDSGAKIGPQGLQHPEMQAAYPSMWDKTQQTVGVKPQTSGYFNPDQNVVQAYGPTTAEQRSAALHEYQHAIQNQEGFAPGTELVNPISRSDPSVRLAVKAKNDALMSGNPDAIAQATLAHKQALYDIYAAHAGEVEARNVQARRDFTPEQRRAIPPWETQDVPDALQLGLPFLGRSR